MLIAMFHDRRPTQRLKVSDYDYRDDKIVMYWSWKGQKLYTEFSEFGADRRTMAQQEGESGPRRRVSSLLIADREVQQGLIR